MTAILGRELSAYFKSPIGYVFIAISFLFSGFFFWLFTLSSGSTDTSSVFLAMFYVFMIFVPVLTMRLMADENKQKCWPDYSEAKLKEFKDNHKFLRVTMTPNAMVTSEVPKSINEDLVTIEFKVSSSAKKNTTGQIIIPVESRRTRDYKNGHLMCSVYESADISSTASPYVDGLSYDCSKALLNFKVI